MVEQMPLAGGPANQNQSGNQPAGAPNAPTGMDKPKIPTSIIVAAAIIVAALAVGNYIKDKNSPETEFNPLTDVAGNSDGNTLSDTGTPTEVELNLGDGTIVETTSTAETPTTAPSSTSTIKTDYLKTNAFAAAEKAEFIINSTQGKASGTAQAEHIVDGVVADPQTPDTYYFATYSYDDKENFVGIYKYNVATYRWQRLYKNTYQRADSLFVKIINVLALQNNKLILLQNHLDETSADPCASLWLRGTKAPDSLVTMDLAKPRDTFGPYVLPDDLRQREIDAEASCQAE